MSNPLIELSKEIYRSGRKAELLDDFIYKCHMREEMTLKELRSMLEELEKSYDKLMENI